jgi:hypothetical protein
MERSWGTLQNARGEGCTEKLITDIIQEYNTKWDHGSLGMTPEAIRAAAINLTAPNAVIHASIAKKLDWAS